MSEVLRVGLVAEGCTDRVVVRAALGSILGERPFLLRLLQPEESLALEPAQPFTGVGKGWGGVYFWCREALRRSNGNFRDDPLFMEYDLLILHLDADVAGKGYADYEIDDSVNDLPCEEPCPPSAATTDRLRQVLLRWIGETTLPPRTVFCTPSKSSETWVVAALFPDDIEMQRKGWECHPNPEARLAVQPVGQRVKKSEMDYKKLEARLIEEWPRVSSQLSEAERFGTDVGAQFNDG